MDKIKIELVLVYIGILILTIIGITSAEIIYSGECRSIEFPNVELVNWSVEGNLSDMEGFSFNKIGTNITYCFDRLYKSDNFTITFYNYQLVEVVEQHIHHGGGGGCIYNKTFNWNCTTWSECAGGQQTRTCKKYNNCGNTYGKPNQTQTCVTAEPVVEIPPINDTIIPPVNPPAKSWFSKYKWWLITSFFIILLIVTFIIYKIFIKKITEPTSTKIKNDSNIQSTTKTPE